MIVNTSNHPHAPCSQSESVALRSSTAVALKYARGAAKPSITERVLTKHTSLAEVAIAAASVPIHGTFSEAATGC